MNRNCMILKAVLLLREVNRHQTKEAQITEVNEWLSKGYMTDDGLQEWIDELKKDLSDTRPQWEKQGFASEEAYYDDMATRDWEFDQIWYGGYDDRYTPSATNRDYGPSNPWDAPGMCVSDFI